MDETSEFIDAIADRGLDPGDIKTDGIIHRFSTWGDQRGEASGAYWHNGRFGWFQDWRTMGKAKVISGTLSDADRKALAGSFNGNGQKVSREALEIGIRRIWNAGTDPDGYPYLLKKQIKAVPQIKQYDGKLIVPVFGINNELNGLQRIGADGTKRFLAGTRKKGSFFSIAGSKETYVICEGFATGVSIYQATGFSIAVAFDAGNLLPVAKEMCAKVGSDRVIIAGDRDSWKIAEDKPDTGTKSAKKAASVTGATVVLPVFQNADGRRTTDFNDLFIAEGAEVVKMQIKKSNTEGVNFDSIEPVDIFGDTMLAGRPTWPVNACPESIYNFAKDESERIGVDVEMIAFPAITCATIAISDKFEIQPKQHDTRWTECPRLWVMVVSDSGQKKSPCFQSAFKPLKKIEKTYYFQHQEDMAEYSRLKQLYDREKKLLIKMVTHHLRNLKNQFKCVF